jgi:tRNA (mo5U34)-methyltransferase
MPSRDAILEQVRSLHWAHSIDLGNGVVTPGYWPRSDFIERGMSRVDFRGKKVLDVGCWDALRSFEAEKRGAREVYATDSLSQRPWRDQPTVELARQALRSSVRYYPNLPVYDVPRLGNDFDVALVFGVYYHLKNPLLAFTRLRQALKTGGLLLVEGEVLNNERDCYARFHYRQHHHHDASNWWVPTIACLRQWIECSFFEIEWQEVRCDDAYRGVRWGALRRMWHRWRGRRPELSRCLLAARAVRRADDNYLFPVVDLRDFDRTTYHC